MACLQCWGHRCEEFHASQPGLCAAAPDFWEGTTCAAQTGGGPSNLSPVSAVSATHIHDSLGGQKCRRVDLTDIK